jgi:hypothetical protein
MAKLSDDDGQELVRLISHALAAKARTGYLDGVKVHPTASDEPYWTARTRAARDHADSCVASLWKWLHAHCENQIVAPPTEQVTSADPTSVDPAVTPDSKLQMAIASVYALNCICAPMHISCCP